MSMSCFGALPTYTEEDLHLPIALKRGYDGGLTLSSHNANRGPTSDSDGSPTPKRRGLEQSAETQGKDWYAEADEKEKDWLYKALEAWPGYGLFNLVMTSSRQQEPAWSGPINMICGVIIFLIQVVTPIALVLDKYDKYDEGFCPKRADLTAKVVYVLVALLHCVRVTMMCWTTYGQLNVGANQGVNWFRFSRFQKYAGIDFFMTIPYDFLAAILNLWLVFTTDAVQDMVLNAIAIEFITQIDDEFKKHVFTCLSPDGGFLLLPNFDLKNEKKESNERLEALMRMMSNAMNQEATWSKEDFRNQATVAMVMRQRPDLVTDKWERIRRAAVTTLTRMQHIVWIPFIAMALYGGYCK